jgi:hypothetical protein
VVVVAMFDFPQQRLVMGMNTEVADAYKIGAFMGAMRAGKSSDGRVEGFEIVAMGGTLVNLTILVGGVCSLRAGPSVLEELAE